MKKAVLLSTEENLLQTMNEDLLDRNKDLKNFCRLLQHQQGMMSIPWWRSHPIHKNRATESIWTEPCNPLLRATKSTKRATFNL